jgi:hypothetical protein|tara:strand:- start:1087 stop:1359 length:273 start_codon:yes stop_codon:yes gene_type:complete
MTKNKEPINIADRLRKEYKKAGLKKPIPETTSINIKSVIYTAIIVLIAGFVIIGGVVLIPLGIIIAAVAIIFVFVKAYLSEENIQKNKDT